MSTPKVFISATSGDLRAIHDLLRPAIERGMTFDPPVGGAGTRRQVAAENGQVGRSTRIYLHRSG